MKVQARVQLQNYIGSPMIFRADTSTGVKKVVEKKNGGTRLISLKGFGIDLNGDGKVRAGEDGFLAFPGKDGTYDVQRANRLLKAFSDDFDANEDGKITKKERQQGRNLKAQAQKMDLDGDNVLQSWELQRAGAKIVAQNAFGAVPIADLPTPVLDMQPAPQLPYSPPPMMPWTAMFPFSMMNPFVSRWPFLF